MELTKEEKLLYIYSQLPDADEYSVDTIYEFLLGVEY